MKNYLNETLFSILCFIIHGQGSPEKGFMNCETEIYFIALVFLVCTQAIKIGRVASNSNIFCLFQ